MAKTKVAGFDFLDGVSFPLAGGLVWWFGGLVVWWFGCFFLGFCLFGLEVGVQFPKPPIQTTNYRER